MFVHVRLREMQIGINRSVDLWLNKRSKHNIVVKVRSSGLMQRKTENNFDVQLHKQNLAYVIPRIWKFEKKMRIICEIETTYMQIKQIYSWQNCRLLSAIVPRSALKIEAECSSETLVSSYQTVMRRTAVTSSDWVYYTAQRQNLCCAHISKALHICYETYFLQ